jgi:hypothetical protein
MGGAEMTCSAPGVWPTNDKYHIQNRYQDSGWEVTSDDSLTVEEAPAKQLTEIVARAAILASDSWSGMTRVVHTKSGAVVIQFSDGQKTRAVINLMNNVIYNGLIARDVQAILLVDHMKKSTVFVLRRADEDFTDIDKQISIVVLDGTVYLQRGGASTSLPDPNLTTISLSDPGLFDKIVGEINGKPK